MFRMSLLALLVFIPSAFAGSVSDIADSTAQYAAATYQDEMVQSLTKLVSHNTVAVEGVSVLDNPAHKAFKQELSTQAKALGLDFHDYGYVVMIGLGEGQDRVGVITHGDVQPVNPAKWAKSPFELDLTSEPGNLVGRGTEDDKGPISAALYAMKAIKDQQIPLSKRIELYVYLAEESDWAPLEEFVKTNEMPEINITIDANYPVVTAEKGYGTISLTFPNTAVDTQDSYLSAFEGGFFGSQIPEDAKAVIANADKELLSTIKQLAENQPGMQYDYQWQDKQLTITALGVSAHSSTPEDGINAVTHLAEILSIQRWPNTTAGNLVNFINDNLGTGLYGEKFGQTAYEDDFMGPLTVSPTVLKQLDEGIQLNINIRLPQGKSTEQLESEFQLALAQWQQANAVKIQAVEINLEDPFVQTAVPQIDTLLSVFSHYTGTQNAQPVSIGGGTNSRLFPNAVSFGPSMPGAVYTGHSEHEFISMQQFVLNLKMYTAALIELAK